MNSLKQAYKNKIENLKEKYTTTSIIIYHILILTSFIPIPTIEHFLKTINPNLNEIKIIVGITAIFFLITSAIAFDFFFEFLCEFEKSLKKYPKFNNNSIAGLFFKKNNQSCKHQSFDNRNHHTQLVWNYYVQSNCDTSNYSIVDFRPCHSNTITLTT